MWVRSVATLWLAAMALALADVLAPSNHGTLRLTRFGCALC